MPNILTVDDETTISSIVEKFLTKQGFSVTVANSGEAAIEIIRSRSDLDCIILDIKMPGLTGVDVLKAMRQDAIKTPVIILSGSIGVQDNIEDLQELGYHEDDVLYKPVDLFELPA